jgi:hypothetical protein
LTSNQLVLIVDVAQESLKQNRSRNSKKTSTKQEKKINNNTKKKKK